MDKTIVQTSHVPSVLLILFCASMLDFITTANVLEFCPNCEGNPMMVYAMNLFGSVNGILYAKLLVIGAAAGLYASDILDARQMMEKPVYLIALAIGAGAYMVASVVNMYLLLVVAN